MHSIHSIILKLKANRYWGLFNGLYTLFFVAMAMGIPWAFSDETRSVFEINKLLVLRFGSAAMAATWLIESLFFTRSYRKTGLEIPIALWVLSSIASTVFSLNPRLSLIGSYDRWEGLITTLNYCFLVFASVTLLRTKAMVAWVLGTLLVGGAGSAVYGVIQSLGLDTMSWSADATLRVFGCINNPVHYCPYVSMLVPVGLGVIIWFCQRNAAVRPWVFRALFVGLAVCTALLYYAQYLSYSRATWTAFIAALSFFYIKISTTTPLAQRWRQVVYDGALLLFMGVLYLSAVFFLHNKSETLAVIIYSLVLVMVGVDYWLHHRRLDWRVLGLFGCIAATTGIFVVGVHLWLAILVAIALVIGVVTLPISETASRDFLLRYVIIGAFIRLQFVGISWIEAGVFLCLWLVYGYWMIPHAHLTRLSRWVASGSLILFAATLSFSSVVDFIGNAGTQKTITSKINSYKNDAIKGTARTSMWKSSWPWFCDNWVVGTGLDTIKYAYPKYRRSDYGPLEGGHHFTPDRLHNEYLNTLASKGALGFFVYYGLVIGGLVLGVLMGVGDLNKHPKGYVALGCLAGALIYLGQVLFNFGVVATLFLFYVLLSVAFVVNQPMTDQME